MQDMAGFVPGIELTDNRHLFGVRCPDREVDALSISKPRWMRSQLFVHAYMAPLIEQK